ncbi:hypothetical protein [Caviibacter abscessus]|uniref:hypothetical protein n=1 Tax=Caviibacter abscessus TaxID=1766719 RepID=UPI000831402E|nr:hypothetical protein [Caviibacter abscessus]
MDMKEYEYRNNKATYFRIKKDMNVEIIEPSFLFELIYFDEIKLVEKQLSEIIIEKPKKIKRQANLSLDELKDRLFRALVNKDKYHCVNLANELMLRDKEALFDILYKLSFLSLDENKLIKTYLFEYLVNNVGYKDYILKNLIVYFTKSCANYVDFKNKNIKKYLEKNVTKLYEYIYTKNINKVKLYEMEVLDIKENIKMSVEKETIFENLVKREKML